MLLIIWNVFPGGGDSLSGGTPNRSSSRMKLRKRKLFSGTGTGVDLEDIPIESDYKGPSVKFPLTLSNLQEIVDAFNGRKVKCQILAFFYSRQSLETFNKSISPPFLTYSCGLTFKKSKPEQTLIKNSMK